MTRRTLIFTPATVSFLLAGGCSRAPQGDPLTVEARPATAQPHELVAFTVRGGPPTPMLATAWSIIGLAEAPVLTAAGSWRKAFAAPGIYEVQAEVIRTDGGRTHATAFVAVVDTTGAAR